MNLNKLLLKFILACSAVGCFSLAGSAQEPRKLAVVVGIDVYRQTSGLPNLKHATTDAHQLAETLRSQGYKVFEMTHTVARQAGQETMAPNSEYIRDQIKGVLGFPNLGAGDSVILSFHGHGVQYELVKDAGKPEEVRTPKFYFCAADSSIEGLKTAGDITDRNHLLPLEELYESLGNCTAATRLLIVDACRNDPNRPTVFKSGVNSGTLPKLPPPPGGIAAFFSCKANQRAVEDTDLSHGVFTHFLVQGLQGKADQPLEGRPADGIVTFAELSAYVANNTYAHVYEKYKVPQSPELRGEYDLNLPLSKNLGSAKEITNSIGMKLVLIKAGTFMMGSPESEEGRDEDETLHEVTLTKDYYLGSTEVTQGQWQVVMGTTPWKGKDYVKEGANYPATYIRWVDAMEFCRKLSTKEGKTYQLPTEAQWEYGCRGGTTTAYSFGANASRLSEYAWWGGFAVDGNANLEQYAHEVGQKLPNEFGLYDMHGNVFELCSDSAVGRYPREPVTDPTGSDIFFFIAPPMGEAEQDSLNYAVRRVRGGSWKFEARFCRSASHTIPDFPYEGYSYLGFRVVLDR